LLPFGHAGGRQLLEGAARLQALDPQRRGVSEGV
jgi:hypothetical protein